MRTLDLIAKHIEEKNKENEVKPATLDDILNRLNDIFDKQGEIDKKQAELYTLLNRQDTDEESDIDEESDTDEVLDEEGGE